MYKLNKRNVKRDKKALEFITKAKEDLEHAINTNQLDGDTQKNPKDLKSDLIMQIFKDEEVVENDTKSFSL
jgi:hypothetical protein